MRKNNTICSECNKPIYRRPFQMAKGLVFCSVKCSNKRKKTAEQLCPICGNVVIKLRRAKYCNKTCANEAIRRLPRKPRSNKLRHWRRALILKRGSKCNRCPIDYVAILEVHHIIEKCNGGSDDEDNLEVLCPTCHTIHHHETRIKKKQKAAP